MSQVIAFANQKGGVGKTTLCLQAAFHYALKEHKKVLLIDMDCTQANTTRLALAYEEDPRDYEIDLVYTRALDLFRPDLEEINTRPTKYGIDLIGATLDTADSIDEVLYGMTARQVTLDSIQTPRQYIQVMSESYDVVLIDCQPILGPSLLAPLCAADFVVCPMRVTGLSQDGYGKLLSTLEAVKQNWNPELHILGAVINDVDKSVSAKKALEALASLDESLVFRQVLRHRAPVDTAMTVGAPIWKVQNGRAAAREFAAVFAEMDERMARARQGGL